MPKLKISEYSSTAASNTDIGGIDIDENCLPSNLNDAIRELMAQIKEFQDGTSGDPIINTADSQFNSTGALKIPVGTASQRPTPAAGMLRFNDDTDEFEGYNGTAWASVGGGNLSPRTGFRNRIINGDMRIDQRNNGASVTLNSSSGTVYGVDRFPAFQANSPATSITIQRSTTAPAGFINSLGFTVATAKASLAAADRHELEHKIEGLNVADLGWGTANAQTVTLSFWVRSSLTGTFGGSVINDASNRCYPFSFAISVANTFEYKTITIPGDTTGTWLTDTGVGIKLRWSLGTGSTFLGTAGSWQAANLDGVTGQVNLVSTTGATFYITGVQLEKGTVATPFEFRSIGQEEILCKRYFQKPALFVSMINEASSARTFVNTYTLPVAMRATPTILSSGYANVGSTSAGSIVTYSPDLVYASFTAAAGLTTCQASFLPLISSEL